MNIIMHPVTSSQIKSIGYNEENGTLYIEFNSGVVYEYYNVSKKTFETFITPTVSVGKYFHTEIKTKPDQLYTKTAYRVVDGKLVQ